MCVCVLENAEYRSAGLIEISNQIRRVVLKLLKQNNVTLLILSSVGIHVCLTLTPSSRNIISNHGRIDWNTILGITTSSCDF